MLLAYGSEGKCNYSIATLNISIRLARGVKAYQGTGCRHVRNCEARILECEWSHS